MQQNEYERTCVTRGAWIDTQQWVIGEHLTVPVHVSSRTGRAVIARKELDEVLPANPLGLYYQRFRQCSGCSPSYMAKATDGQRRICEQLLETAKLLPNAERNHNVVRRALFLDDFAEFSKYLCSEWRNLTLQQAPAMKEVHEAGISSDAWFSMWQECLGCEPRLQTLQYPLPAKGAVKAFAEEWASAMAREHSDASSPDTALQPQVVLDHSVNDEMLGRRKRHNVVADASIEYVLAFDADEQMLKRVVQLLDLASYDEIDGVQVIGNFLHVGATVKILDAYPAKGSTDILALDRTHAMVDTLHEELCGLLEHLQAIDDRRLKRKIEDADRGC